jgi:ureidoglycolate lyase
MVALGERPIDFVVVQYANGVAEEDCQETEMGMKDGSVAIDLTGGFHGEKSLKAKL